MKKIANLYLAFVFLVLYIPIFYLIAYAFNAGEDMNRFTGFSLSHFQNLFEDSRLILILVQTFFLAFLSSLIATLMGLLEPSISIKPARNIRMPFCLSTISSW